MLPFPGESALFLLRLHPLLPKLPVAPPPPCLWEMLYSEDLV